MFLLFATGYSFPKITDLTMTIFYNVWQSFGILSCKIIRCTSTWLTKLVALLCCGAFYWHDLGPGRGTVTANRYISTHLLYPRMKHFDPDGSALFQDNQVPVHRAWLLAELFDEWENYIHNHQISTHLNTYGRFLSEVFDGALHHQQQQSALKACGNPTPYPHMLFFLLICHLWHLQYRYILISGIQLTGSSTQNTRFITGKAPCFWPEQECLSRYITEKLFSSKIPTYEEVGVSHAQGPNRGRVAVRRSGWPPTVLRSTNWALFR